MTADQHHALSDRRDRALAAIKAASPERLATMPESLGQLAGELFAAGRFADVDALRFALKLAAQ